MKQALLFLILMFAGGLLVAQSDLAGPGRAIQFDGVDDFIEIGDVYDDLTMPFTVAAWVKLADDAMVDPIFVSQDNQPLYNGFWFCVSATELFIEYGDGRGENHNSFRKGKAAPVPNLPDRWIYFTAVVKSETDIQLYVNGLNVGGAPRGNSTLPMASDYPQDVAKIGYFLSNSIVHRFKGLMDEVRIWNRSLTETEIRDTMCRRLKGNEPGLIGYWNFDETGGDVIKDSSPRGYDGVLKGNPARVYSGAPVGDESVNLYSGTWAGMSLTHGDLSVSEISGDPFGIHIYQVNLPPSQTGGLPTSDQQSPYYGVFLADHGQATQFSLAFADSPACALFQREDNADPVWRSDESLTGISKRTEIILADASANDLSVDLGPDVIICDADSYRLTAGHDQAGKTFLWSTGESTPSIDVSSSGKFAVKVMENCTSAKDTITLLFNVTPATISLGEDEALCEMQARTLSLGFETAAMNVTWSNGSSGSSLVVEDFGTYWARVENGCGVSADTITFSQRTFHDIENYNFFSPDKDSYNPHLMLDPKLTGAHLVVFNRWGKQVFESSDYQNDWDGGGLPSGIYFYTFQTPCMEAYKGTVTIIR